MTIKPYKYVANKICTRCIMDDSVKGIIFDSNGECTFCKIHDELNKNYPLTKENELVLNKIIQKIKEQGKGKPYDCIVGISGGKDSSYTLVKTVEFGLRPLAVHFDNGWNSELAVNNIEKLCSQLKVDLYTHVANWEEFKDLQLSFLKASVPDGEVPTDFAITSVLYEIANKKGIKNIIGGNSFRTEGTTPLTWTYQDPKYIKAIHKKFGKKSIKSFPIMSMYRFLYLSLVRKIKWVRILYYIPYNEDEAVEYLKNNYGWRNYGGKHFESNYTKFFQSYILIRKFNIDKRKLHYSAKIRSAQMKREDALLNIKLDPFLEDSSSIEFILKKLELTENDLEIIMNDQIKSFKDYPSYYSFIRILKKPLTFLSKIGIVPEVIIKKYFSFG